LAAKERHDNRVHLIVPIDMTTDLGIIHSANLWIELHGERAIAEARIMAAEMRAKGDVEGADTWLQIIVIEEMRRNGKLAGRTY
jgi:hypothetical protein